MNHTNKGTTPSQSPTKTPLQAIEEGTVEEDIRLLIAIGVLTPERKLAEKYKEPAGGFSRASTT